MTRAAALAIVLLSSTAFAQSAKDKKVASEKVKQAIAKSQAGDHDAAITLYNDAYKIIPQPLLLSNIGSEYQQLKKPVEALGYFCKYLEADPAGSNASFATAQAKTLYIELGGTTDVDDRDVCKPIVKAAAPTPTVEPIVVEPEPERVRSTDTVEHRTSTLRWAGIGTAGVGVALVGVGVVFGVKAKSISDDITNHPATDPWDNDIRQQQADGASAEKKQIIFLATGGVAIAAGVTMYFLGGNKTVVVPTATGESVGLAATGGF